MKYTTNYLFKKPEATDTVNINDFNDSFDLVDAALKAQANNNNAMLISETTRIASEAARVASAIAAQTAETNRSTAESLRVTEFNTITNEYELALHENTDIELVNARKGEVNLGVKIGKIDTALADIAINVKIFGAKGDGITNDTVPIQNALNSKTYGTVLIPDGDYLISATLTINNHTSLELSKNARIFTNTILDDLIIYNPINLTPNLYALSNKVFIKGGTLDGNNLVKNLLKISQVYQMTVEDIRFFNFKEKGLWTNFFRSFGVSCAGIYGHNLEFRNAQAHFGSVAIYNQGYDNHFDACSILDVETGIVTWDGLFTKCNSWLSIQALIPNSCFADIRESFSSFIQCTPDTLRYPFKLANGKSVRISNLNIIYNEGVYTPALATTYPITLFTGDFTGMYFVNDGLFVLPYNMTMCNMVFPNARFVNNRTALVYGGIVITNLMTDYNPITTKIYATNTFGNTSIPTDFTTNQISICDFSYAGAVGFPDNSRGILTTYRPSATDVGTRQKYEKYSSTEVWERYAIDSSTWSTWVKISNGGAFTTGTRPTNYSVGQSIYDTTLNKPIWLKTVPSTWIDATGAIV